MELYGIDVVRTIFTHPAVGLVRTQLVTVADSPVPSGLHMARQLGVRVARLPPQPPS